jgi:hypothetical protein
VKLIFCNNCRDIVKLKHESRNCECGESGGRYIDDLYAEVWGPCIKIGFANGSFLNALYLQTVKGDLDKKMDYGGEQVTMGRDFKAFIIPESAKTMTRVDVKNNH